MPNQVTSGCNGLTNAEIEVASLLKDSGEWADSHYFALGCQTYTNPEKVSRAFRLAGYSRGGDILNFYDHLNDVYLELFQRHPLVMAGAKNQVFDDAHMWVCDGYRMDSWYRWDAETGICNSYAMTRYHLNWGWRGDSNGWYAWHDFRLQGELYDNWMRVWIGTRPF